jgi:hypothetical protein
MSSIALTLTEEIQSLIPICDRFQLARKFLLLLPIKCAVILQKIQKALSIRLLIKFKVRELLTQAAYKILSLSLLPYLPSYSSSRNLLINRSIVLFRGLETHDISWTRLMPLFSSLVS